MHWRLGLFEGPYARYRMPCVARVLESKGRGISYGNSTRYVSTRASFYSALMYCR